LSALLVHVASVPPGCLWWKDLLAVFRICRPSMSLVWCNWLLVTGVCCCQQCWCVSCLCVVVCIAGSVFRCWRL
jgi:hypothetical protein